MAEGICNDYYMLCNNLYHILLRIQSLKSNEKVGKYPDEVIVAKRFNDFLDKGKLLNCLKLANNLKIKS